MVKLITVILASLIVWSIYRLEFTFSFQILCALIIYSGVSLIFLKWENKNHDRGLVAIIWSFCFFSVYYLVFFYTASRIKSQLISGAFMIDVWSFSWFIFTILLTVFLIMLLMVMPNTIKYSGYKWYVTPVLTLLILRKNGLRILHLSQASVLLIWIAIVLERTLPAIGEFIAFLVLLYGIQWMQRADGLPIEKFNYSNTNWFARIPLVLIIMVVIGYTILFGLSSFWLSFIITLVAMFVLYFLLKIKWFRHTKYVLFLIALLMFVSLMYLFWFLIQ